MTIDMKFDLKLDWAFQLGSICNRPGIYLTSHIFTFRWWHPLFHVHAAACCMSRAFSCIRTRPRAFTCTCMVSLYQLDAECFQPGFQVLKNDFFFACLVHCVPFTSRAACITCLIMHPNTSACIYVHPRASTRIREGAVLEESVKSKITLISVTICSFSICDRRYLNVREKSFKVWYWGLEGIWGVTKFVNRAL